MATPSNPVLYWRTSAGLENTITNLPNAQKVNFELVGTNEKSAIIESIESFSDENTVEEPEISADGTKTLNKQNIGALPEGIMVRGHVDLDLENSTTDFVLTKIRSFARKAQLVETNFEFGIFGFYSNVSPFFDINPSAIEGYTLKPPIVSWNAPKKQLDFSFRLLLGGSDLS